MLNKAENEMSGVISTAMSFLALYRDDVVANNIATSDFSITDLMRQDKPVSLYLVVPPSDKDRLKPLIRLIINQVVRRMTEDMAFKDGQSVANYKHRLLLMIDEFPSLGKLDIFEEALAFIAGYGLKAYLICQDKSQLDKPYTRDESITSNSHLRVIYAPNKIETAEWVSRILGKRTVTTENTSISYAGGNVMPYQTGMSGGLQYQGRELLTPDEVMRLKGPVKDAQGKITEGGDMVILSAGGAPIYGQQILYFFDPVFSARSKIIPGDKATAIPDDAPSQVSAVIPTADFGEAVVSVMTENMNKVMDKALAEQDQGVEKVIGSGNALDSLEVDAHDDPDAAAESAAPTQSDDDTQDYESDAISEGGENEPLSNPMREALAEAMAAADRLGVDDMESLTISISLRVE
jgi:type IV secretion system protein VirD4